MTPLVDPEHYKNHRFPGEIISHGVWLYYRNKQAAKKFFRKLLKGLQYVPRVIITEKLKSYGAAKRDILLRVEHRQSRYLNNRCENSQRPTRQREYRMQGFKSACYE